MSNYIYAITDEWQLERYDEDGTYLSTERDLSDDYPREIYETPNYVYCAAGYDLFQFNKNEDGTLVDGWIIDAANGGLRFGDDDDIFVAEGWGGEDTVSRYDSDDGSLIWSNTFSDISQRGSTILESGNFVVQFEGDNEPIHEYDSDSGVIVNTLTFDNNREGISRDSNDNYVVPNTYQDVEKMDRDGEIIWSVESGEFDVSGFQRGYSRYYGYNHDSSIFAISDSGTQKWTLDDGVSDISVHVTSDDNEVLVYVNDNGMYAVDGETGNQIWANSGTNYRAITAQPTGTEYRSTWIPTVDLSGTVELQDSTVENAEIIAIDDEEDEFAARTQSDVDGNWSVEVPDSTIHVIAQYTDADGNLYNSESYPYVNK